MTRKLIKRQAQLKGAHLRASFLNVQANDLVNWFTTTILARTKLSVLLRTLIHSTGRDLQKVDFPGNDDAERAGWDGFIEASSGTPWIPSGASGWEFGVTADIKTKAEGILQKASGRSRALKGQILRLSLSLQGGGRVRLPGSRK